MFTTLITKSLDPLRKRNGRASRMNNIIPIIVVLLRLLITHDTMMSSIMIIPPNPTAFEVPIVRKRRRSLDTDRKRTNNKATS